MTTAGKQKFIDHAQPAFARAVEGRMGDFIQAEEQRA